MIDRDPMAACGLDCGSCSLRRYPFDDAAAAEALPWFRSMGWLAEGEGRSEAIAMKLLCSGCRGERGLHWSADCWILACCVDAKRLAHCDQCPDFPCPRLVAWSQTDPSYGKALASLREAAATRRQGGVS